MMTLREISTITGFSVSTVSKALNNRFDINTDTRKYIQDIANKNNYVPNKNAISLRKSKSHIIAVILPQVNNSIYSEALFAMQKTASNSGYRIMLFQSFTKVEKEKQYLDEINDGSVDGAVVLSITKHLKNAVNRTIDTIPIQYLIIEKNQKTEDIKQQCIDSFKKLLKQIK